MPFDRTPPLEKLLYPFLEQARDHALLFFDVDEHIVWASPGAENILGATAAELVGRDTCVLFIPEDVAMGIPLTSLRSRAAGEVPKTTVG